MKHKPKLLSAFLLASLTIFLPALSLAAEKEADLPRVLIIGDSISGGYYKSTVKSLEGKAAVSHNPGNGEWTGTGVKKIDEWLGDGKWDVIHFNWGLWDIYGWRYAKEDRSPKAYAERLETLVTRMEKTGAKLIWATTTPVCPGPEKTMLEKWKTEVIISPELEQQYRDAALEVMKRHNVQINDLYATVKPELEKLSPAPDNVHFNGGGSQRLAAKVSKAIIQALDAPPVEK